MADEYILLVYCVNINMNQRVVGHLFSIQPEAVLMLYFLFQPGTMIDQKELV